MDRRPQLPPTLGEVIVLGFADLDDADRRLMELLALGEPMRLADLIALTAAPALESCEARGLVTLAGGSDESAVTLAHPLYGEVVRSELPPMRSRVRFGELASVMAGRTLSRQDKLRLTRWQLQAGLVPSSAQLVDAARIATETAAPRLAAQLARHAKDAGAGIDADLVLARALSQQREFGQAEALLLEAEPKLRTREQAATYLELQSEVLHWGLSRPADLRALLDRAARWWPDGDWQQTIDPLQRRVRSFEQLGALAADSAVSGRHMPDGALTPADVGNLFYLGDTRGGGPACAARASRAAPTAFG